MGWEGGAAMALLSEVVEDKRKRMVELNCSPPYDEFEQKCLDNWGSLTQLGVDPVVTIHNHRLGKKDTMSLIDQGMGSTYPYPPQERPTPAAKPIWQGNNEAQSRATDRQVGGDHYKNMGVEPIVAMKHWLTPEEYRGYLRGNIIKYQARAKSGKEPIAAALGKAAHYQQFLTEFLEEESKRHAEAQIKTATQATQQQR